MNNFLIQNVWFRREYVPPEPIEESEVTFWNTIFNCIFNKKKVVI